MAEKWNSFHDYLSDKNVYMILNALDEGVHIVDQEGRTIFYNQKVSETDGLKPGEVLGRNIFESYPSLTLETSTLMQTLKTGKAITNEQQTFINSKGKKITTINRTIPLEFKDGEKGAMEISRDITQLEELTNDLNSLRTNLSVKGRKTNINKLNNNTCYSFKNIIGESTVIKKVMRDAMRAAGSDSSVLLVGETGTGKELFAQGIHNASSRRNNPFIAQNCAALPKNLLEGLLFGTEKGSFTGAQSRPGLFEQADGGTIMLDEINSMDPALQAKLLRVIQENRVRRIGGQKEIDIDVRIIATMNMNPDKAFREQKLREDLFYRLSVVYLELPPLRERREDIPVLTAHFIDLYNQRFNKSIKSIDKELEDIFEVYDWPGNIRELQHVIECVFNMLQSEEIICFRDLPGYIKERIKSPDMAVDNVLFTVTGTQVPSLDEVLENIEQKLISTALETTGGNISAAARKLKVSRQSLQYKLKKYMIQY